MGSTWYPTKEADFLAFAQSWSTHATATPTAYNWVAADATALAALIATLVSATTAANDPATRTSVTVAAKDVARAAALAELKALKKKLEGAQPPIAANKREELGLPPKDATPTPVPPPSTRPLVAILATTGLNVSLRLTDENTPTRRSHPVGVSGAEVFSFTGATAPADLRSWTFEGLATRSDMVVAFPPAAAAGTKIFIAARWYNNKGDTGPVSATASSYVGGGLAEAA